uniref:Major facilitator superfamily (MFS) profile domain-containing protein n=1 Tax=Oryza meridionalis TaxID=40149 RepID=A0A0E0ERK1_9ORYZ
MAAAEMEAGRRTLALVNMAAIMERADEALLPAVYREVGAALHATPMGLGALTLCRSFVQAPCYPLAAYAAVRYNRAHVVAAGAFLWAAATFLVAVSDTFAQVAVARGLNGVGLALVTPAIQSLVADCSDDTTRGSAFGWLQLTGNIGSVIGGLFSLMLASTTIMGVAGWRVAFHIVALISVIVGALVRLFAVDPHFCSNIQDDGGDQLPRKSPLEEMKDLVIEARAVVRIPSFQIIVAQGVTGSFPWSALSFAPMWLELMGFTHEMTGLLTTSFALASSLGGLLGGKMGDHLAVRYPDSGRIVLSQISSASAIPLAALLLLALPDDSSSGFLHGFVMFIMGLSISWNGPATNNPIFAEIVPERSRTSIYALDRSFESVLASFAPPIVGFLAEHAYGYNPVSHGAGPSSDKANAAALAKALYTTIAIPMLLCCFIYSLLYGTYPRDRERARMDTLIASELQQIELERCHRAGTGRGRKDATVIDVEYGEKESGDDDDEKALMRYHVEQSGSVVRKTDYTGSVIPAGEEREREREREREEEEEKRFLIGEDDGGQGMTAQQQQQQQQEVDVERERRRTLVLVNLASIMERADEALLPAVYREVGAALHSTPAGLGALTLCRSAVQAACYPLAAYAAARHNRAHVIAAGAFLWAAATFLVAVSDTFLQVAISRGLNGIGLALVVPSIQSLVADSTDGGTRGSAFGWLQLASSLGFISGGFVGLLLAQTTVFGIAGWRIAFHLVAIISVFVGILNWFFAVDPHFPARNVGTCDRPVCKQSVWQVIEEMIKRQRVSGSFPWSALSFASMWLELIGFSHKDTAFLMTTFWVASSFGGLLGGKMGDLLALRYPNSGRIVLSQISAGSAVPLAAVLLLGLPDDPSKGIAYGIVLFIMGVFISWNGPATNMPICAEIVPEKSRTSIYALDMCFESVLSSFTPPIVGILAQRVFGYRADNKGKSIQLDRENAASLAKALYTSIAIPFTICTSIYSFLYCSYPRDRERAQVLMPGEERERERERERDQRFLAGDDDGGEGMMGQQLQQPEVVEVDVERERRRTLVLVNLASIMERADEALLPAVYREVGAALHATPAGLGALTLCRSAVQAACYPLAAYAAARHNRAHVIAAGAFLWAAATFLVAVSDTFLQVALARGLNGIGLALVVPSIQSLVADSTEDGTRGTAFGWLQLASSLGLISGGFVGLLLAQTTVFGIAGWRIAFHLVAIISVFVGILNWFFAVDPHFPRSNAGTCDRLVTKQSAWQVIEEMIKEAKFVVQIPTFQIFVAQGVSGTFPWSALSFASMWLELIGFSHKETAFLMTIFWVASSFGGLLGGKMGDFLALHYPNAGRIVLSQISAGSAVPLAAVLLLGLPDDPSKGFAYGIVLFIMGVFISWNGPATNFPIFAEIVPEKSRTSIYALDRSFESVLASFAPPIVGILAQRVYGYRPDNKGQSVQLDRENAASLAKALYTSIAIPFTICTSIYSFLYCSYPRDRERARMQSLIESELQQMEQEGSCLEEGDCRFLVVDSPQDDEIATIEVTNDAKGLSETEKDTAKLLANRESTPEESVVQDKLNIPNKRREDPN